MRNKLAQLERELQSIETEHQDIVENENQEISENNPSWFSLETSDSNDEDDSRPFRTYNF